MAEKKQNKVAEVHTKHTQEEEARFVLHAGIPVSQQVLLLRRKKKKEEEKDQEGARTKDKRKGPHTSACLVGLVGSSVRKLQEPKVVWYEWRHASPVLCAAVVDE